MFIEGAEMTSRIVLPNYLATYGSISEGIGSQQCARLIQAIEKAELGCQTQVSQYRGTVKVRVCADIVPGTVIATLLDGTYPNEDIGNHVAIFVAKLENGIRVFDQYVGRSPGQRDIRYRGGQTTRGDKTLPDGTVRRNVLLLSNDADFYYVVEA